MNKKQEIFMKKVIRKIDSANRLRMPKEEIELLGINKGDSIEIFYEDKKLISKKFIIKNEG
jgi:bifunctional DNA-binding transcriptional regulator/antitoxin component of YhaV-PrlF toxin-antitoxin module